MFCTFLSLYLRGKEKEMYPKKEKTRNSFLRPAGVIYRHYERSKVIRLAGKPALSRVLTLLCNTDSVQYCLYVY